VLEDRRLGREQSPLEEGRRPVLADVLLFLDEEGGWPKGTCSVPCPCRSQRYECHFFLFRVCWRLQGRYCELNPGRYIPLIGYLKALLE
jgi:hypothetical protein